MSNNKFNKMKNEVQNFFHGFKNKPEIKREKNFPPTQTIPYPEITIQEMISRYTRGESGLVGSEEGLVYDEEVANPKGFDLSDLDRAQEVIEFYREKEQARQHAKEADVAENLGDSPATPKPGEA